jgi:hypothetical protein
MPSAQGMFLGRFGHGALPRRCADSPCRSGLILRQNSFETFILLLTAAYVCRKICPRFRPSGLQAMQGCTCFAPCRLARQPAMAQLKRSKSLIYLSVYTCEAIPCYCKKSLLAERPFRVDRKAFQTLFRLQHSRLEQTSHDHVPTRLQIGLARFRRSECHCQLSILQHISIRAEHAPSTTEGCAILARKLPNTSTRRSWSP